MKLRKSLALAVLCLGVLLIGYGLIYNLDHIDDALDPGHVNSILQQSSTAGEILIILAPLIAKRYIWFFILLGLGAILTTWLYFAN